MLHLFFEVRQGDRGSEGKNMIAMEVDFNIIHNFFNLQSIVIYMYIYYGWLSPQFPPN